MDWVGLVAWGVHEAASTASTAKAETSAPRAGRIFDVPNTVMSPVKTNPKRERVIRPAPQAQPLLAVYSPRGFPRARDSGWLVGRSVFDQAQTQGMPSYDTTDYAIIDATPVWVFRVLSDEYAGRTHWWTEVECRPIGDIPFGQVGAICTSTAIAGWQQVKIRRRR